MSLLIKYAKNSQKRFAVSTSRWLTNKIEDKNLNVDKRKTVLTEKTPHGRLDDKNNIDRSDRHRDAEKQPLPEWPEGKNPYTGEMGGPKGPEPTRFGDWERKGRVTDF